MNIVAERPTVNDGIVEPMGMEKCFDRDISTEITSPSELKLSMISDLLVFSVP